MVGNLWEIYSTSWAHHAVKNTGSVVFPVSQPCSSHGVEIFAYILGHQSDSYSKYYLT